MKTCEEIGRDENKPALLQGAWQVFGGVRALAGEAPQRVDPDERRADAKNLKGAKP